MIRGNQFGLLVCFLVSSALAIYVGFFAYSGTQGMEVVKYGGYWLMLLSFVLLLYHLLRAVLGRKTPLQLKLLPFLYVVFVSVLLYALQDKNFKILMDEPVLAATALQMHEEKEVMAVARAYTIESEFYLLDAFLDKRPYFYPFLTSLLHDVTGYRALQGVWLNMLLTPLLLGLLFLLASRLAGSYAGYLSVALFATVPLLAMNVNGAGFDLLNLVMLLAVALAAIRYSSAHTSRNLDLLLVLTVLLVQTRYESAIYAFLVAALILWSWWRENKITITPTLIVVPLLLIMVPIQHGIYVEAHKELLWQLKGDAVHPFSLGYIPSNLVHAWAHFFSFEAEQPNSVLLSALFLAAAIAAGFVYRRRLRLKGWPQTSLSLPVAGFVMLTCANFFLLMAYNWGQLDDIIATRIALPFIMLQALVVAVVYAHSSSRVGWRILGLVACVIFFLGVTVQKTRQTDFLNRAPTNDAAVWFQNKVREHKSSNPLFVADLHMIAVVEKASTLASFSAPRRKKQIDFHHYAGTFGDILFFYQLEELEKGMLAPPLELTKHFDLEVLEEAEMAVGPTVHLARLRSVKLGPEDGERLHETMPDPEKEPVAYAEFFARSLP